MALKLIEPPTVEPVAYDAITQNHLEVVDAGEAAWLTHLISIARETCEEISKRAYMTQKWELWLDKWDYIIKLPRPPLQSVTSIKWYDADNTEHTIGSANYLVDNKSEPGRVIPVSGYSWPPGIRPINGVCITYVAGHAAAANVPKRYKQAILMLAAEWNRLREATAVTGRAGQEFTDKEVPYGVKLLLGFDEVKNV